MVQIVRRGETPFVSLRDAMSHLFEESFTSPAWVTTWSNGNDVKRFPVDVWADEGSYYVYASLPGVNPDDVHVSAQDNELTISAEFKAESREGATSLVCERGSGTYARQVSFPTDVAMDNAEATYQNGVLFLTLPKAEHAKVKTIKVKSLSPAS